MNVKFESTENEILLNPRMAKAVQTKWINHLAKAPSLSGHVWISTSGSSGCPKWAALSKHALLVSAAAVNRHLNISSEDRWLNPLPLFHVGGLGILARAYLSQSRLFTFQETWDPILFTQALETTEATLTSLVPTQIYDIITHKLMAPKSLRGCFVGGGALNPTLYEAAKKLGWPLLISYGLTECSSQVATSLPECNALKILSHVQCRIAPSGRLEIKSDALLTLYAAEKEAEVEFYDPKVNGWFETEDRAEIHDNSLRILGREAHFIKIGGESVNLNRLRTLLEEQSFRLGSQTNAALIAIPDERLGHVIHLALEEEALISRLVDAFNAQTLPYERIRKTHLISKIPLTAVGKIDYTELTRTIEC